MTIFSVIITLGSVLGLIWTVLQTPERNRYNYLLVSIWVLFGALVGGRIAYVAVHWEHFQEHHIEIPQIWLGGMAWPGALAGGLLFIALASWIQGIQLGSLADGMLPLLASLSVTVWLGCMFTGCAYGSVTDAWWGMSTIDEWGDFEKRLPVQLIMALLTLALFWGIEQYRHRHELISGLAACLSLGGLSISLLCASFLRVDPYPLYKGVRMETWAALFYGGIALFIGGFTYLMSRR